jgi:hypothetical protein
MRKRGVLAILAALFGVWAGAQNAPKRPSTTTPKGWKVPLTPDGVPDLQGTWTNATLTPLQRAANLKEFYTEAEAAAFERETIARNSSSSVAQSYNDYWFDRGNQVVPTLRTSLIVDPPDGRVPSLTDFGRAAQQERQAARRGKGQSDGPEMRSLAERCIVWPTGGPPMMPSFYNNNYQIVQGPGYVAIMVEMIHDVRIIPTDGRPHVPDNIRTWMGDPVGHWEGDTLVVETTNFNGESPFNNSSREMRLIEKFRRVNDGMMMYEFTVNDPAFTRPWTAQIPMTTLNEPVFEYACNEGNYAMKNMLAGAREEEKAQGR